jgi:hypothetical protein
LRYLLTLSRATPVKFHRYIPGSHLHV